MADRFSVNPAAATAACQTLAQIAVEMQDGPAVLCVAGGSGKPPATHG